MKINQASGALDQMLRQTRAHHVQLSTMADAKANSLMTISAVVTTFSASGLFNEGFRVPVITVMCFNLLTILLATFTVMPSLSFNQKKLAQEEHPSLKTGNLLFFGTFAHMSYPQFEAAMEDMMNDHNKTYEMQVREVYLLGVFLAGKKYRTLKYAYACFLTGIFAGVTILILTHL